MQTKVTKKMAALLNKNFKNYEIKVTNLTVDEFKFKVNYSLFDDLEDFDSSSNTFKVIKVLYPFEYYAMPTYLTTRILTRLYENSDKTLEGFLQQVFNSIEI